MAELEPYDNEELANEYLLSQYQKPEFTKVMNVLGKIFNKIQANDFLIKDGFWVDDAINYQLTILANMYNVSRGGKSDDDLRPEVNQATTASNSGTIPQLKGAMVEKFGGTFSEFYAGWVHELASYIMVTDADITTPELENLSVGGVGAKLGDYLYSVTPEGAPDELIVKVNPNGTASTTKIIVVKTSYAVDYEIQSTTNPEDELIQNTTNPADEIIQDFT